MVNGMLLTSKAQKARRAWLTVALMVLAWAPAPAQGQDGDGGTQSVFSIGAGSRAISLGGAYVSLVDDASSIFWNPAALRNVQDKQLMGM